MSASIIKQPRRRQIASLRRARDEGWAPKDLLYEKPGGADGLADELGLCAHTGQTLELGHRDNTGINQAPRFLKIQVSCNEELSAGLQCTRDEFGVLVIAGKEDFWNGVDEGHVVTNRARSPRKCRSSGAIGAGWCGVRVTVA